MTKASASLSIDESKLNEFMGKAIADMGAAIHAVMILIGDRPPARPSESVAHGPF